MSLSLGRFNNSSYYIFLPLFFPYVDEMHGQFSSKDMHIIVSMALFVQNTKCIWPHFKQHVMYFIFQSF